MSSLVILQPNLTVLMIKYLKPNRPFPKPLAVVYTLALASVLLCIGCNNGSNEKIPDISATKIDLKTSRFDLDLYSIDTNNIGAGLHQLAGKYPDFLNYFLDTVMAYGIHGNYTDTTEGIREGLKTFLSFKGFKTLEDTIKKDYPDNKDIDAELKQGFAFMKYYFPNAEIPRIIYLNMGLSNWSAFPVDARTMCIGLDMFLGENFPYYRSIGVPGYMAAHLRKNYIPVAVFAALYKSVHPFQIEDKTLLELMIERGKEQYFLHKILPHMPDSVLFGMTGAQAEWCNENEALIYNFFIHDNLLFSKDTRNIQPYVFDGPNTPGIPATNKIKSTPGNLGTWLGYRIVNSYMNQQDKVTLKDLTEQKKDAAKVLDEAKYRPK